MYGHHSHIILEQNKNIPLQNLLFSPIHVVLCYSCVICIFRMQVSKPYTAFFSDDSLESMRTKEEVSPNEEVQNDELGYSIPSYNVGDAGEAQGDDNVYGDGDDMDMDDGGFGDDWVQLLLG